MYNLKHLNNQEGFSFDCNENIWHSIAGKYVIGNWSKLNTIEINSQTLWFTCCSSFCFLCFVFTFCLFAFYAQMLPVPCLSNLLFIFYFIIFCLFVCLIVFLFCFVFCVFLFVVFLCLFLLVFIVGNTEFYANSRFFNNNYWTNKM
jgi:hypothetical protein